MEVIKRDGSIVKFDANKIKRAIELADAEVSDNEHIEDYHIYKIMKAVELTKKPTIEVEEIQDIICHKLMEYGYYELAEKYITYRYKRELVRKSNSTDDLILSLIRGDNEELNGENSNKNTRIASTQRDYMAGIVSHDISNRILLPPHIVEAHKNGVLHFHENIVA